MFCPLVLTLIAATGTAAGPQRPTPAPETGLTPPALMAKDAGSSWLSTKPVGPQRRSFGVGLQVGFPSAVTFKLLLGATHGLQGGVGGLTGWAHYRPVASVHLDYVWHALELIKTDGLLLTGYVGGGAVGTLDVGRLFDPSPGFYYYGFEYFPLRSFGVGLGARLPVGVALALYELPLEFYAELIPTVMVFPGIAGGLGGTIGFRAFVGGT